MSQRGLSDVEEEKRDDVFSFQLISSTPFFSSSSSSSSSETENTFLKQQPLRRYPHSPPATRTCQ